MWIFKFEFLQFVSKLLYSLQKSTCILPSLFRIIFWKTGFSPNIWTWWTFKYRPLMLSLCSLPLFPILDALYQTMVEWLSVWCYRLHVHQEVSLSVGVQLSEEDANQILKIIIVQEMLFSFLFSREIHYMLWVFLKETKWIVKLYDKVRGSTTILLPK